MMALEHPSGRQPVSPIVGPIQVSERLISLDVIRGFALFGILLVNLYDYLARPDGAIATVVAWGVTVLAEDNFYPLFSLLFGAGFAVQMGRAAEKGSAGTLLYVRRLVVLFGIGLAFYVLLEDRNILVRYAMLGFPLLLFRGASSKALLYAAIVAVILSTPVANRAVRVAVLGPPPVTQLSIEERAAREAQRAAGMEAWRERMASGSYVDFVRARAAGVGSLLRNIPLHFTLPHIFASFLLGAYAVRRGLFEVRAQNRRLLWTILCVGAVLGAIGESVPLVAPSLTGSSGPLRLARFCAVFLMRSGWIALSVAYAAALLLLLERSRWERRLLVLAPLGRMALTNYIMQSVFMTLLFYGYGLGLHERIGPVGGAILALGLTGFQILFSRWWLGRFRFGPAEWLWRSLTYGRVQPLAVEAA